MLKKIFPCVVVSCLVLLTLLVLFLGFKEKPLGSVESSSGAYVSTTTRSTSGSGTYSYPACIGSCVLGSIVVTQPATAGYSRVWNATSTATTTYTTTNESATSTFGVPLANVLSASDVVGTLTYDIVASKGLVIETSSDFNGEYVFTWKR